MKKTAFHPLRKLALAGNPNRPLLGAKTYTPPLIAYLEEHGISPAAFQALTKKLNGQVVTPFDPPYASGRMDSDNAFNRYPLMIVYCTGSADVVEAVKFCSEQNLAVCMRAGGHSTEGYSVLDGRVLIDVSNIKGIFVDEVGMTSTVGAGVTWGEYNQELNAYGLHNPGGSCNSVGMAGYTMGGGYGYTSMRWGIACDSLLEVRMVTATGEIVTANAKSHPELLWAHQGGTGGNFGIVVGMKYKLEKLKDVWPIQVNWPIDDAAKVLKTWQDKMTKTLQDLDLGLLGFLAIEEVPGKAPGGESCTINRPYFCIRGIYSGASKDAAQAAMQPLLDIGTPSFPAGPLWQHQIPYAAANEHLLDNVEGIIPDTIKETKRCAYIERALSEQEFQKMVDYFKTSPNPYNIVSMEPYGGAINKVAPHETAFVHRNAYFDIFTDSFWMQDSEKAEAFRWLKDYYESPDMKGLWSNRYYQNYVNAEYKDWQHGYFGENYDELQQVKAQWDPDNRFRYPQSIEPAK
ncbi:FAD-binding protein [Pseudoduganella eburnea]|uniref:FAD-binding protein n=1 Tax=Massilia eburnea TaxID=1776165 RepID=A0A6L6QCD8_9BURK|nr:FAD-binding oxidoreductase [Massilia eburnea]MTW09741.1 FAD-binding protein [Massilia eburnea]